LLASAVCLFARPFSRTLQSTPGHMQRIHLHACRCLHPQRRIRTQHLTHTSDTLVRTCSHAHAHCQADGFTHTDGISQERHTHTHMHTHEHTQLPTCTHTHTITHRHTKEHARTSTHTYIHKRAHIHTQNCTRTRTNGLFTEIQRSLIAQPSDYTPSTEVSRLVERERVETT
jgi:hypothetical protein